MTRRHERGDRMLPGSGSPTVAVVGCPNAGKSTLINRLSGSRVAVVHETPGVTRDRKAVPVEWTGVSFELVDTGGFDSGDDSALAGAVREQVLAALRTADVVVFVVDARSGPLAADHEMADLLRRVRVPLLLVANKLDTPQTAEQAAAQLFELGLGPAHPVSALHGLGTGDLLDEIVAALADRTAAPAGEDAEAGDESLTPVVIVGRPNAGKSSLFNAIAGEGRAIVSDVPGTTRDAIDTRVYGPNGPFLFVDTAGMRKASKVSGVEYYAYLRSLQALDRAHVAVVVLDATVGIGELDLSIATEAARRGCATVLALNKTDIVPADLAQVWEMASRRLRQRPPVVPVSAITGAGIDALLRQVAALHEKFKSRAPTPVLNRTLAELSVARPGPRRGGRRLKMYYIAQYGTAPPRFAVEVNDRTLMTREFGYYVENRLRDKLGLDGVPLIIDFKGRQRHDRR